MSQLTEFAGRVVLVTGASRGIGAEVARRLASDGTHVIVNYREKVKRARAVVEEIIAAGGHASSLAGYPGLDGGDCCGSAGLFRFRRSTSRLRLLRT